MPGANIGLSIFIIGTIGRTLKLRQPSNSRRISGEPKSRASEIAKDFFRWNALHLAGTIGDQATLYLQPPEHRIIQSQEKQGATLPESVRILYTIIPEFPK